MARSFDELPEFDAAVIAAVRQPQEAFDQACAALGAARVFAPPLLRVSRGTAGSEQADDLGRDEAE